jgi:hypothetical protein
MVGQRQLKIARDEAQSPSFERLQCPSHVLAGATFSGNRRERGQVGRDLVLVARVLFQQRIEILEGVIHIATQCVCVSQAQQHHGLLAALAVRQLVLGDCCVQLTHPQQTITVCE